MLLTFLHISTQFRLHSRQ